MKSRIVLVEDNRMERRNAIDRINQVPDCEICQMFANGKEALEWLTENEADILITDIQMPVLNGIGLIRSLAEEKIEIEKIVISAYSEFGDARELVGYEIIEYVMKPFIDYELEEAIKRAKRARATKLEKQNQLNSLMMNLEKMRPVLLDNFFRMLILMPKNSREYVRKNEEDLKITLSDKYKTIVSISIDELDEDFDFNMYSGIVDLISAQNNEEIQCYPLMMNENEITVVALHKKGLNVLSFAIELKNIIIEHYAINVFMGVSKSLYATEELNALYNQSRSIVRGHNGGYKNVVISYNELDECENEHELSMDTLQNELKELVYNKNADGCMALIRRYMRSENSNVWLRNFTFCYVNILEIILNEVGDSFNNLIGYEKVWESLAKFDSIINLEQWLYNLTTAIIYALENSNVNEKLIANKVIRVIEESYNQKISVKHIADKLSFSREYLHRVFVHVTGVSVLEYLTKYRLERAKGLLLKGMETEKVSELVGYGDKGYFAKVFKKYTGVSPSEYKRQKHK